MNIGCWYLLSSMFHCRIIGVVRIMLSLLFHLLLSFFFSPLTHAFLGFFAPYGSLHEGKKLFDLILGCKGVHNAFIYLF